MEYHFRNASLADAPEIWRILQQAIRRRKEDGSDQWQDGYPNEKVIQDDIEKGIGFVLTDGENIAGYCAVLVNDEPQYESINGEWLTNGDFVAVHRVAVSEKFIGKGLAQKMFLFIERYAIEHGIDSIKADTNYDNMPMLKIFSKMGYSYCGEVFFRGGARKAYEKILRGNGS